MSSMEELMQYAKDSQCACYVCATLRKMLIAQMYAEITRLKEYLAEIKEGPINEDMEDVKET